MELNVFKCPNCGHEINRDFNGAPRSLTTSSGCARSLLKARGVH
ncbi:zinc ribbon domain-containing protein [Microcoleus vaginatus]